jgi:hypothetical protein
VAVSRRWLGAGAATIGLLLLLSSRASADEPASGALNFTGEHLTDLEVAQLLHQAGFAGEDLVRAVRLVLGESEGHTHAHNLNTNGTTDWGIAQINDVNLPWLKKHLQLDGLPGQALFDPELSAVAMFELYDAYGFKPWHGATEYHTLKHTKQGMVPDVDRVQRALKAAAAVDVGMAS